MRTETGPDFQTLDVPNLSRFAGSGNVEVRAYERRQGKLVTGIALAGSGGGPAFMGGFLALAGALSERSGLSLGGAITAGVGLVMVAPGVYLIATSGSKTEIYTERGIQEAGPAPLLGAGGIW